MSGRTIQAPEIGELLPRAKTIGGRPSYICPVCSNGSGKDGTGITEDPKRPGHYHCFKCDFDGDAWDIMDRVYNRQPGDSYKEAYKAAGAGQPAPAPSTQKADSPQKTQETHEAHAPQYAQYIEKCAAALPGSPGESYLQGRGLCKSLMMVYRLGYDAEKDAVIIPYPGEDYYISRSLQGKEYRKPKGQPEPIFNAAAFAAAAEREEPCFICEGQIDALSIIEAGGQAVAIGGAGDRKLVDYDGPRPRRAYIVADNDEAGEKTAQRIRAALGDLPAEIVHPPKACKDVNDLLRDDRGLLLSLVKGDAWRAWEYAERSSAAAYIADFWKDAKTKTPATPTGFKQLDAALDGGIYEGLYILGAVSSLGKTTFCLQIADQIARNEEQDVIIFSLEMARSELIAKSISRLSRELCQGKTGDAKTARAITDPERIARFSQAEKDLLNRASAVYKDLARHLWINEGLGTIGTAQIREAVARHIEITGRRPLVIIDYLQILASPDPRMSDKQATDRNVFELKRISRDYKIPVVAVSSFNRDNYTSALNMAAFKESGAIEYSSDVLIGLQPQGMTDKTSDAEKAANARTLDACKRSPTRMIELKILKQRNGQTGDAIALQYTAMFNYFREAAATERINL